MLCVLSNNEYSPLVERDRSGSMFTGVLWCSHRALRLAVDSRRGYAECLSRSPIRPEGGVSHGIPESKHSRDGEKITVNPDHSLSVPDKPIIPYIEGDETGVDISPVMIKVVDAAAEKAYGGQRRISWMEVYAGEKATQVYGPDTWLSDEALDTVREYVVATRDR